MTTSKTVIPNVKRLLKSRSQNRRLITTELRPFTANKTKFSISSWPHKDISLNMNHHLTITHRMRSLQRSQQSMWLKPNSKSLYKQVKKADWPLSTKKKRVSVMTTNSLICRKIRSHGRHLNSKSRKYSYCVHSDNSLQQVTSSRLTKVKDLKVVYSRNKTDKSRQTAKTKFQKFKHLQTNISNCWTTSSS